MSQLRSLTEEEAEHKRKLLARDHSQSIEFEQDIAAQDYAMEQTLTDLALMMEGEQ